MPLTSRSPHIDAMVDRAKAGEVIDLFPRAYLADDQGVRSMRQVYEVRPARMKRGASKLTLALAGMWLVSAAVVLSAFIVMFVGVLCGLAALSAAGAGR